MICFANLLFNKLHFRWLPPTVLAPRHPAPSRARNRGELLRSKIRYEHASRARLSLGSRSPILSSTFSSPHPTHTPDRIRGHPLASPRGKEGREPPPLPSNICTPPVPSIFLILYPKTRKHVRGSQKILNAKAFRIFTFYLFTLHFSLKIAFRIF